LVVRVSLEVLAIMEFKEHKELLVTRVSKEVKVFKE